MAGLTCKRGIISCTSVQRFITNAEELVGGCKCSSRIARLKGQLENMQCFKSDAELYKGPATLRVGASGECQSYPSKEKQGGCEANGREQKLGNCRVHFLTPSQVVAIFRFAQGTPLPLQRRLARQCFSDSVGRVKVDELGCCFWQLRSWRQIRTNVQQLASLSALEVSREHGRRVAENMDRR